MPPAGDAPDPMAVLDKPQALKALRRLAAREPMNQREFALASTHSPEQAKALRDALERVGVLAVRGLPGHGNAGEKEIRLTPAGRAIAEHLLAVEGIARSRLAAERPAAGARHGPTTL